MILIAPREKTALRPGHLPLVPTMADLSPFASPARRNTSASNTFKMNLLHKDVAKFPGMIFLHKMTVWPGPLSRADNVSVGNPFRICTLDENSSRHGRACKSFKMISLYDSKNNLPGMISLRKKGGGYPPVGALSMPNRPSGQDGRPSEHRERGISLHYLAQSTGMRTCSVPIRDIISLRNSKGHLA